MNSLFFTVRYVLKRLNTVLAELRRLYKSKDNLRIDFLVVIMAIGIARRRVRTTTTTTVTAVGSLKMAAILQLMVNRDI